VKFYVGILVKELLVFSIAVNNLRGCRRYHHRRIFDQSEYETSLSAACRTGDDSCKRMDERYNDDDDYDDASCEPNLQSPLLQP